MGGNSQTVHWKKAENGNLRGIKNPLLMAFFLPLKITYSLTLIINKLKQAELGYA